VLIELILILSRLEKKKIDFIPKIKVKFGINYFKNVGDLKQSYDNKDLNPVIQIA
jgi:hypothetical protein